MSLDPKRPVTLEDLLRLKRAERPPTEFWEQFDRTLRAKQLAALVEKRPWWRTMPSLFAGWRRYHLPLGATAVLAITVFALRDRPAPQPELGAENAIAAAAAANQGTSIQSAATTSSSAAPSVSLALPASTVATPVASELVEQAVVAITQGTGARESAENLASVSRESPAADSPTSSRLVAASFTVAQMTEPSLGRGLLATPALADASLTPTRASVEPLAQIATATSSRFARLKTAMAAPVVNTVARATDRVARDLSDDRLSEDAIRRFAAKGDRFSVKF